MPETNLQTASEMKDLYGVWGEHPDYPKEDWKYEIANDDTVAGYWDWVEHQMMLASEEE